MPFTTAGCEIVAIQLFLLQIGAELSNSRRSSAKPRRTRPSTSSAAHRAGYQLVLLVQFSIQYLRDLSNRVIRNSAANPYGFKRLVRTQLPNHSYVRSCRVLLPRAGRA